MKIEGFTRKTASVAVDFGDGQILNVSYYPNELRLDDILRTDSTVEDGARELARLLAGWDLEQDDAPVDPTFERLRTLPFAFLAKVQNAIAEDMRPGEATGSI